MSLTSSISSTATVAASLQSMAMATPALTTTFVPTATACVENRLTMLENRQYEIWLNMPVPVPGTTFTECYPSQYITSWLLSAGSITQPAFSPLVCPQSWSAVGPYISNYIACCPSGYSFHEPDTTVFTDRPAFGGTCYTSLYGTAPIPVIVTKYGNASVTETGPYTASATNAQAYAYPMDGYAFGVAAVASLTSTSPSASSTASSTGAATAATHTVIANSNPVFNPTSVSANIGDSILFLFESGNHSVTQSTFDNPCTSLSGGFDSGFEPTAGNATISVTSSIPQWFYSKQGTECQSGMVFGLNPSSSQTFTTFYHNALNTKSKSSSGTSAGVKAGAAIGAIAGAALILVTIFYFWRRHRRNAMATGNPEQGNSYEQQPAMVHDQSGWPVENKPPTPPGGAELHHFDKPGELENPNRPVELHNGNMYHNEPVEMWSPDHEALSYQPPGYRSIDNDMSSIER